MEEIRKSVIPRNQKHNLSLWLSSNSGKFLVKSTYLKENHGKFEFIPQTSTFMWQKIWNSNLHNRHKHFFWKVIVDTLPTLAKLNSLFPIEERNYLFCNLEAESTEHIFLKCPLVTTILFNS